MSLFFIYQEGEGDGSAVPTLVWRYGLPPSEEDIVRAKATILEDMDVVVTRLDLSRFREVDEWLGMEVVI